MKKTISLIMVLAMLTVLLLCPMSASADPSWSGASKITSSTTVDSESYSSSSADENALLVSGSISVTLSNITANKTGSSSGGDDTSFYGINSAIIAKDGASLTISNATITTDATGANGVFSYGGSATTNNTSSDGTTVTISDSTITTTEDSSGGIMTTGGGIMNASNLTVTTAGISSAAIRTDRGGGTVTVDGGTYTTTGAGSPTIYSTADVTVFNADLISEMAEGIVIEGKNTVTIDSCNLVDSNTKLNGQSTTYKNIFLYQSMSGDADEGNSTFTASNSTITTNNGDSFYVTNATAVINLENNTITNNDSSGNLLRAQADSWGNSGSNGGDVTLNATNQALSGTVVIDSISTLRMNLSEGSSFEGTINADDSAESITLTLDETSTIKLTGDSYVSELNNSDEANSNIDLNGYSLYVDGTAIEATATTTTTTTEETIETAEEAEEESTGLTTAQIVIIVAVIAVIVVVIIVVALKKRKKDGVTVEEVPEEIKEPENVKEPDNSEETENVKDSDNTSE